MWFKEPKKIIEFGIQSMNFNNYCELLKSSKKLKNFQKTKISKKKTFFTKKKIEQKNFYKKRFLKYLHQKKKTFLKSPLFFAPTLTRN